MLRLLVALVMAAHGIGHLIGVVGAWRPSGITWGGSSDSWLLSPALGEASAILEVLLFGAATVAWIAAAGLLLAGHEAWRGVAVGGAITSLVGLALFPAQLPTGSMIGAVAVNVLALVALLLLDWPSTEAMRA
jgi:hypothetical protein